MSKLDLISPEVKQNMERVLQRYPKDKARSAVVEMLLQLQRQNGGFLTEDLMQATAEFLNLPPIQVYEIATFYDMYELNIIGKHKIAVCTNVSCMLAGSDDVLKRFKERLNIEPGQTSEDGQFSLRAVECLAACTDAPVCQVDDAEYVDHLTPEKVDQLIDSLQGDK